jgi:P pilus assembly chaperone PapD
MHSCHTHVMRRKPGTSGFPLATTLAAALAFLAGAPANAQLSMSVTPVRVEHSIPPGQMRTEVITVQNVSLRPLRARVTVADWYLERDGTPTFVKRGKLPAFSMSEWVEVNPTEFEVPPTGTQTIRYTVSVPEGTADASYRTAILIESLPDFTDQPRANVAYLTGRIGVMVYDRVGSLPPEAEIVNQEVISDPEAPGRQAVKITLRNPGLVNFRISGESRILDPDRRVLQTLTVRDAIVLPRSEREVLVRFEQPVDRPAFNVLTRIDVGLGDLLEIETRVGSMAARQ